MNNYFVILAAGKSTRFHKKIPKQFYNYKNKEIIDHSIEKSVNSKLFKKILVEPINSEAKKLDGDQYTIDKGLWSKKEIKKLYLLGNRLGSSSMYEPDESTFDLHDIKKKDFQNFALPQMIYKKISEEVLNCNSELILINLAWENFETYEKLLFFK